MFLKVKTFREWRHHTEASCRLPSRIILARSVNYTLYSTSLVNGWPVALWVCGRGGQRSYTIDLQIHNICPLTFNYNSGLLFYSHLRYSLWHVYKQRYPCLSSYSAPDRRGWWTRALQSGPNILRGSAFTGYTPTVWMTLGGGSSSVGHRGEERNLHLSSCHQWPPNALSQH